MKNKYISYLGGINYILIYLLCISYIKFASSAESNYADFR